MPTGIYWHTNSQPIRAIITNTKYYTNNKNIIFSTRIFRTTRFFPPLSSIAIYFNDSSIDDIRSVSTRKPSPIYRRDISATRSRTCTASWALHINITSTDLYIPIDDRVNTYIDRNRRRYVLVKTRDPCQTDVFASGISVPAEEVVGGACRGIER